MRLSPGLANSPQARIFQNYLEIRQSKEVRNTTKSLKHSVKKHLNKIEQQKYKEITTEHTKTAHAAHRIITEEAKKTELHTVVDKSQKNIAYYLKLTAKEFTTIGKDTLTYFQHKLSSPSTEWLMNYKKFPRWARYGGVAALGIIGFNWARTKFLHSINPNPDIPAEYERGYDVIKDSNTDFGSPVNLLKTASKIITPYYSTVRRARIKTVASIINSHPALFASNHAIRHNVYGVA